MTTESYYVIQEKLKGAETWYDVAVDGKREHLAAAVQRANQLGFANHMFQYRVLRRIDDVLSEQGYLT